MLVLECAACVERVQCTQKSGIRQHQRAISETNCVREYDILTDADIELVSDLELWFATWGFQYTFWWGCADLENSLYFSLVQPVLCVCECVSQCVCVSLHWNQSLDRALIMSPSPI